MNQKRLLLIYRIVTGVFTLMMLGGAGAYFVNHAEVAALFGTLGYPGYIVYPLAILKILGIVAIWSRKSIWLKEWAYMGYMVDFSLATAAHLSVGDGEHYGSIMAMVIMLASYVLDKRVYGKIEQNLS